VYRQKGHPEFIRHMRRVQIGEADASTNEYFKRFTRELPVGSDPMHVYWRRRDVNRRVEECMAVYRAQGTPVSVFEADEVILSNDTETAQALDASCPSPRTLSLCVGMAVYMTSNLSVRQGLTNGVTGRVVEFGTVEPDVPHAPPLSGAPLPPLTPSIAVHLDKLDKVVWVGYRTFDLVHGEDTVARRRQYPLRPAQAMTTHKMQGSGVERMYVDLSKMGSGRADRSTEGLLYTALTRVTGPNKGLRVRNPHMLAARAKAPAAAREFERMVHMAREALGLSNAYKECLGLDPA
jgi:hypothetical protein